MESQHLLETLPNHLEHRGTIGYDVTKGGDDLATWLTGTEAIKHMRIGRATFYRLVKEGKITPYGLPGVADPRYKQEELDALYTPIQPDQIAEPQEP